MEHHAAVDFEGSTIELWMSQSEAPYLKDAVYEAGHLASCEAFVDGAVPIDRVQRDLARDGNPDHPGPAILSEEFLAVYA